MIATANVLTPLRGTNYLGSHPRAMRRIGGPPPAERGVAMRAPLPIGYIDLACRVADVADTTATARYLEA